MRSVLAGDLGGTKCRFALVGEDFSVHRVQHVATVRDRVTFLAAFDRAITAILDDVPSGVERPRAAGFGTAGVIPVGGRAIDRAPNLPLDGFPLGDHVEARFHLTTTLLNDGRASALGEYLRGHAVGADPLLCLFFGTGIGIGVVVGGRPYSGATNAAGEIGHTTFVPGGRPCPCGGAGHFEAYCGGRAIVERAAAEIGAQAEAAWDVGKVVRAADAGNPTARGILADARVAACTLAENACTLLNPGALVLGGGVLSGWPALRSAIEEHVRRSTGAAIHGGLRFAPSLGGSDAILWGAAAATGVLWPGANAR